MAVLEGEEPLIVDTAMDEADQSDEPDADEADDPEESDKPED